MGHKVVSNGSFSEEMDCVCDENHCAAPGAPILRCIPLAIQRLLSNIGVPIIDRGIPPQYESEEKIGNRAHVDKMLTRTLAPTAEWTGRKLAGLAAAHFTSGERRDLQSGLLKREVEFRANAPPKCVINGLNFLFEKAMHPLWLTCADMTVNDG